MKRKRKEEDEKDAPAYDAEGCDDDAHGDGTIRTDDLGTLGHVQVDEVHDGREDDLHRQRTPQREILGERGPYIALRAEEAHHDQARQERA